jgi:hypothetical protein
MTSRPACRTRSLTGAVALGLVVFAALGCSGGDKAGGTGAQADAAVQADAGTVDTGDNSADAGAQDLGNGSNLTCPGGPGCPCTENKDCDGSLCIDTPQGKECARSCTTSCPDGFKCAVSGQGTDVVTICVPKQGKLCNPCMTSQACQAVGLEAASCVSHGEAGNFCGLACVQDADCPSEFTCQDMTTVEGAKVKQCAPKPDAKGQLSACTCSPAAIAASLSTTCMAATKGPDDKPATCPGQRTCTKDGLSACVSGGSTPEVCDGLDNDCNGKTDDASCDDNNACTQDVCAPAAEGKPAACQHQKLETACDADGSVCTEGDTCKDGVCVAGPAKKCDDGNPCTLDVCDPAQGCAVTPDNGAPCDDDNPCTIGDLCQNNSCLSGVTKECVSTDECQTAKCDQNSGKCAYGNKLNGQPCNDGSICTTGDGCLDGSCTGSPVACDDGKPCTSDACDPASGCTATDLAGTCNDGNACTNGDTCVGGNCQAGQPTACDDGDGCTLDGCDATSGTCTHTTVTGCGGNCQVNTDCDDKNACTDDVCSGGKCVVTANGAACSDGVACTVGDTCANGTCVGGAANCDDKNACTDDVCAGAAGCAHAPNSLSCDDGNACSIGDACATGACQPGQPLACDDGNPCTTDVCDPKTGKCASTNTSGACSDGDACTKGDTCANGGCQPGTPPVCDDGQACTDDKCDKASGGCVVSNNTAACSDNNACTTGDVCAAGSCKPGVAKVCDDKNACTADSCNASTGACVATTIAGCGGSCATAADCDDKNPCTTDACSSGKCSNTANTATCSDNNACTVGDLCSAGVCKSGAAKVCNDGNPCTDDSCEASSGACKLANNTAACNDNNACTTGDVCAAGVCTGKAVNCDDGNPCTVGDACKAGACVTPVGVVCNDNNPCTTDACDKATGACTFSNNTAACSDGNACTTGDLCGSGACKPGKLVACTDNNACTTDTCNAATGACSYAANTATCSDNNACTVGDVCASGACKAGAATNCDDKNACTTDSCNPTTGACAYTNNTGPCSDGNLCTGSDTCDGAGKCVGGLSVVCKGTVCMSNSCNPSTGQCDPKPQANTVTCDDGQACTVGDKCDGTGKCASGAWDNACGCQNDAACNDNNPCTTDKCSAGKCLFTIVTGAVCDDADPCTTASVCSALGKCAGTAQVDCSGGKDQCNDAVCANNNGQAVCKKVPLKAGLVCNDGLFCTVGETCDGSGVCANGLPPLCGKPAQCFSSFCSEAAKGCTTAPVKDGTACDDGSLCTDGDACKLGKCVGTLKPACTPVLMGFSPASPSQVQATAGLGKGTDTTLVTLYPSGNCTGTPLNATPAPVANSQFSAAFTAPKQACSSVSAKAVDAAGTTSGCSNSLVFNHYSCSTCVCPASDWLRHFGTAKTDNGSDVSADAAGNVYVAGNTDAAFTGKTNAGGTDAVVAKRDSKGEPVWVTQLGTALNDSANAVYVDGAGVVWVAGTSAGDIDGAGPGPLPAAGLTDVFVAKFDAATGKQLSMQVYGSTTRAESVIDMAYDKVGNRLIVLLSSATSLGSGLSPDVLAVPLSTGVPTKLWAYIEDTQNKNPTGIAVDSAGEIYVHGRSQWGMTGALSSTGTGGGGMYLYRVSAAGKTAWLQHWGSPGFDLSGGVAVDNLGQVYVTGYAQGVAEGTAAGTKYLGSNGSSWGFGGDVVVAAFTTAGAPKWVVQYGSAGGDAGVGIAYVAGKSAALFVSGTSTGNMVTQAATSANGGSDLFLYRLVPGTGAVAALNPVGTAGDDTGGRLVPGAGVVYVTGGVGAGFVGQSPDGCSFAGLRDMLVARFCTSTLAIQ